MTDQESTLGRDVIPVMDETMLKTPTKPNFTEIRDSHPPGVELNGHTVVSVTLVAYGSNPGPARATEMLYRARVIMRDEQGIEYPMDIPVTRDI